MRIEPDLHLEDWDEKEHELYLSYTKGKLRIVKKDDEYLLQIRSEKGTFFTVKKIESYWELRSLDIFINEDIISHEDHIEYLYEFMSYIRDMFSNFEYLILNKQTGHIYGSNNIFDDVENGVLSGNIKNNIHFMESWNNNEIEIIDLLDDTNPKILKNGSWSEINIKDIESIKDNRDEALERLIN